MKNKNIYIILTLASLCLFSCKKEPVDPRLQYVGSYSVIDSFKYVFHLDQNYNQDTVFCDTIDIELYGDQQLRIVNAKVFNEQIITVDDCGVVRNCQGNFILGTLTNSHIDIKTTDDSYWCEGHGPLGSDQISKKEGLKL